MAPAISNLSYSPTAVYVGADNGTTTVSGRFSFFTTNGGLATLSVSVADTSGATLNRLTTPVPAGTGAAGTMEARLTIGTAVAGDYTFRVMVTDLAGLASNELVGTFRIAADFPWIAKANMPYAPGLGFAAGGGGGRIYVVGEHPAVQIYDIAADTWSSSAPIPNVHGRGAVVAELGGIVYVIGGYDGVTRSLSLKVDALDVATGKWSARAPLPTPREGAAGAVIGRRICVAGGQISPPLVLYVLVMESMDCYDPVTDTWSPAPPMPRGRSYFSLVVIGDFAYAVGGLRTWATPSIPTGWNGSTDRFDIPNDVWSTGPTMLTTRGGPGAAGTGGLLYVIGGYGTDVSLKYLTTVEAYNPAVGTWFAKTPMPTALEAPVAVQAGDDIYVFDTLGRSLRYTPSKDIL